MFNMYRFAVLSTLCILMISTVNTTSMPEFCHDVTCEHGSVCVVRQGSVCTPRFCQPPQAECAPVSTKEGYCPFRLENKECLSLRGALQCMVDEDCDGVEKCCDGCCKIPDKKSHFDSEQNTKPGMCPEYSKGLRLLTDLHCNKTDVVDVCVSDKDCAELNKCCMTLCGNRCKRPLSISVVGRRI